MLGLKGLKSNKFIDINKIKYLVFSLTNNNYNLNNKKIGDIYEKDIFYSLSLVVSEFKNKTLEKNN